MPRLTLCTIARDEEDFLSGCLASVRDVVDAMVVVDTGSRDRTVELAEAAGARVVHCPWSDDFAAARNAALEHVPFGDYVLVLDADERLAAGRGRALRKLARRGRIEGAWLPLHNAERLDATEAHVLDGSARLGEPHLVARLFQRTPDLRWQGLVHEHVTDWARGRKLETVDAPIVHYGATPELRQGLGKSARNLALLERVCALEPANPVYRAYLAQDLLHAGDGVRARREVEAGWEALCALHAGDGPAPDPVPLATLRAFLALRADELELARETLARAREWSGGHPNIDLLELVRAERALLGGRDHASDSEQARRVVAAVRQALERGPRLHSAEPLPGAGSWATWTRLGTLHLLLEEPELGLDAFERALTSRPGHLEASLGRAEALVLASRAEEVLGLGDELVGAGTPDGWILAAVAALQLGARDDLSLLLERAQSALATRELVAPHRRWFLDEVWSQLQVSGTRP